MTLAHNILLILKHINNAKVEKKNKKMKEINLDNNKEVSMNNNRVEMPGERNLRTKNN